MKEGVGLRPTPKAKARAFGPHVDVRYKKVSAALTDRRVTKICAISPPNSNKNMCEERVTRLLLARVLPDGRDEAVHGPPNRSGSEVRVPPRTVLWGLTRGGRDLTRGLTPRVSPFMISKILYDTCIDRSSVAQQWSSVWGGGTHLR